MVLKQSKDRLTGSCKIKPSRGKKNEIVLQLHKILHVFANSQDIQPFLTLTSFFVGFITNILSYNQDYIFYLVSQLYFLMFIISKCY